jgi:hypothetical protein
MVAVLAPFLGRKGEAVEQQLWEPPLVEVRLQIP